MSEIVIMTEQDIRRTLTRIAHEIVENNRGFEDLILIGVRTRGYPLAQRIGAILEEMKGGQIPVGVLDFTLYRDDIRSLPKDLRIEPSDIPTRIADKKVILIDDVLFTGRSVRAALDAIVDWGRPRAIQLAVLVDRGHREMPIRADFVGRNIPSAAHERVQVRVLEIDGKEEVVLIKNGTNQNGGGDIK